MLKVLLFCVRAWVKFTCYGQYVSWAVECCCWGRCGGYRCQQLMLCAGSKRYSSMWHPFPAGICNGWVQQLNNLKIISAGRIFCGFTIVTLWYKICTVGLTWHTINTIIIICTILLPQVLFPTPNKTPLQ